MASHDGDCGQASISGERLGLRMEQEWDYLIVLARKLRAAAR